MRGQGENGVTIYCRSKAVAEVVLTRLRGISYQGRTLEIFKLAGRGFWSKFWNIYEQSLFFRLPNKIHPKLWGPRMDSVVVGLLIAIHKGK